MFVVLLLGFKSLILASHWIVMAASQGGYQANDRVGQLRGQVEESLDVTSTALSAVVFNCYCQAHLVEILDVTLELSNFDFYLSYPSFYHRESK